jgi:hypothetical protein
VVQWWKCPLNPIIYNYTYINPIKSPWGRHFCWESPWYRCSVAGYFHGFQDVYASNPDLAKVIKAQSHDLLVKSLEKAWAPWWWKNCWNITHDETPCN